MINIDTWEAGCKVRAFDWIDGRSIYLNMAYYKPGSSLHQPSAREKSVIIAKTAENEERLRYFLNSIVNGIMFAPGKEN